MNQDAGLVPGSDDWIVVQMAPLHSRLYRYIASLTPVRADAEDLFQKSILTAWQERRKFDPALDLFAWLCGIARNHVRHHYRSLERSRVVFDQDVVEQLAARLLEEDLQFQARQAALARCLAGLPPTQRELVEQYYQSAVSMRDFAARRGLAIEAFYKLLQRIRLALRSCIEGTLAEEGLA